MADSETNHSSGVFSLSKYLSLLWHYAWLICLAGLLAGIAFSPCSGQKKDSVKVYKNLKNTVRINLTNPLIFGEKFNVLGYERVINDYQTASIGMGRFSFPKFS